MSGQAIILNLPLPPPLSAAYRNHGRYGRVKTARCLEWEKTARTMALLQAKNERIKGPYGFTMLVERPDRRKRDLSNLLKLSEDLCVSAGLVEDDSKCQVIRVEWREGPPVGADATVTIFLLATKERSGE